MSGKAIDWKKFDNKMQRSIEKYKYYFGTYDYVDPAGSKIAKVLEKPRLGWAKRAVKIRANKTQFDSFENDTLDLNGIMARYHINEAFDKIKSDVLVAGVGFLALVGDRVMPFAADEATGTFDWYEQNLKDGVAVFRRESKRTLNMESNLRQPTTFIEYRKNATLVTEDGNTTGSANPTARPLMALLTHASTTKRPFGKSVISKPARDAINDASRTTREAMVAAHHYNTKVDVILGADNDTPVDKVESRTGDIIKIGANDNGQIPQIGEFAQHAMAPFENTILIAARNFCADTGLNLANLNIATSAPQSTESLEIINDDLKDDILEWQEELGRQLKYFAVTLYMREQRLNKIDENLQAKIDATQPTWLPIYNADISKFGDGISKIAEKAPEILRNRSVWRKLGLSSQEIEKVISSMKS